MKMQIKEFAEFTGVSVRTLHMSFDSLSELFLMTKMHYQMWLASWYVHNPIQPASKQQTQYQNNQPEQEYNTTPMF